ncbi:hypothetical protein AAHA92_16628 [Salvia divinorum]|uniref:Uncharacterized protein n=1 Tax=Salvia divinorum TaxID=28513 RepID=A0ABD1GX97_SALDI
MKKVTRRWDEAKGKGVADLGRKRDKKKNQFQKLDAPLLSPVSAVDGSRQPSLTSPSFLVGHFSLSTQARYSRFTSPKLPVLQPPQPTVELTPSSEHARSKPTFLSC